MAEKYDPSEDAPETSTTAPTRRDRAQRPSAQRSPARRPAAKAPATTSPARPTRGAAHHVRSFFTVAAVAGLVATVAIPAFAATKTDTAEAVTIQQVAADNAQSLVVASEASPAAFDRGGYSATTPEEIAKVKAEEAAKAALAARVAARSASSSSSSSFAGTIAQSIAASGEVVRPLTSFNNFGTPYAGHKGTDYMADRGTPIYSIADGVVVASTESGPGWGVYVKIAHNIGGTSVTSLYAHMLYGSRQVQVGDTVHAGQLLGQVSDTGRAFGTHLHLEIYVNGAWTNAESWLQANAR
ncbi:M23 family metallopeptidase [Microbacterium sp. W1N]|uniref:M23 family metallopeptidase n=1 Tax=Microbacterium festucae TaxID=2977531 RepID=UPI0021BF8DED|nr:M23 family metallopeptidase [Microbacterium festucae]MCT9821110.1 M23 family metallopeptidase [Microbacterium festucae]